MQVEVGRDSERACSGQELKEFWNATGSRDGADFSKTTGDPVRPDSTGPCGCGPDPSRQAGGWTAGSLLGSTRKPWGSQRFACTSGKAAPATVPASQAQAKAEAATGGPRVPTQPAPDLSCLRLPASQPLSPHCSGLRLGWAGKRPQWPRRLRPRLPSRWVACTSMHIYLGSALVVIGQLVEVFIVPFFTLMNNVHRENMQTQKKIING